MGPSRATHHADTAEHSGRPTIVWDSSTVSLAHCVDALHATGVDAAHDAPVDSRMTPLIGRPTTPAFDARFPADFDGGRNRPRFDVPTSKRWIEHWLHVLRRPTFGQLHGGSPIETTRIAGTSASTAADVLGHTGGISWGDGRGAGRLLLGPFRAAAAEFGRPWIAKATLHGTRMRRLRVSVAIFDYGTGRCGIQIRPGYRRPWSSRRLRRCLRATHDASHRLRELVLAVDFTPPSPASTGV